MSSSPSISRQRVYSSISNGALIPAAPAAPPALSALAAPAQHRIANSVRQVHEASGRVLAWAAPLCLARSPRTCRVRRDGAG